MKQVKGNEPLQLPAGIGDTLEMGKIEHRAWHRLPDESSKAYSYFKMYLALPMPRSIGRLAKQLRMQRAGLGRYSANYKWLDRATAYDDYNSAKELERSRIRREKADLQWQERRDQQRQAEWDIAQQLLDKVRLMLQVPLFKETVRERLKDLDPDGKIIIEQIVTFEPLDWSAVDIARYFEVAAKMARLATGMDTDQKKLRIDVSALSDEELEKLVNEG